MRNPNASPPTTEIIRVTRIYLSRSLLINNVLHTHTQNIAVHVPIGYIIIIITLLLRFDVKLYVKTEIFRHFNFRPKIYQFIYIN